MKNLSNDNLVDNCVLSDFEQQKLSKQRLDCSVCNHHVNLDNEDEFITFSCNVRAFKDETFKVWRCPDCRSVHCLDIFELSHYYSKYPITQARLTWPYRICYRSLCQQLTKHGFSKTNSFLDYGCANGMFIQYLQGRGFVNCHGYDPYAPQEGFGNLTNLQQGPFDYILLQDVIEHIEDAHALLSNLNSLLAPGGYLLIGTQNADNIDLKRPQISDFYNEVHVPYHLHLYTRESLESLGCRQGWEAVDFFDRSYHDTLWFGVNTRAWNQYQSLFDGTINVVYEPINLWKALTCYKYIFYAIFGYWLSFKTGMAIMFQKTGV